METEVGDVRGFSSTVNLSVQALEPGVEREQGLHGAQAACKK